MRARPTLKRPDMASEEWTRMLAQFWIYAERRRPDECWPWNGQTVRDNRGTIRMSGVGNLVAPRVSFAVANGRWPDLLICHSCDNPNCVNPSHLWEGSSAQNTRDAIDKGRWRLWEHQEHKKIKPPIPAVCGHGHKMTPANTTPDRRCRACRVARVTQAKRRKAMREGTVKTSTLERWLTQGFRVA